MGRVGEGFVVVGVVLLDVGGDGGGLGGWAGGSHALSVTRM